MGMFGSFDIAASGVTLGRIWLDAIAHNMANLNTINPPDEDPFRAKLVVAREQQDPGGQGRGVEAAGVLPQQGGPRLAYDPRHPYADEDGNVQLPIVDLPGQMADLIIATRHYQANLSVIRSSREAYEDALRIGRT